MNDNNNNNNFMRDIHLDRIATALETQNMTDEEKEEYFKNRRKGEILQAIILLPIIIGTLIYAFTR